MPLVAPVYLHQAAARAGSVLFLVDVARVETIFRGATGLVLGGVHDPLMQRLKLRATAYVSCEPSPIGEAVRVKMSAARIKW